MSNLIIEVKEDRFNISNKLHNLEIEFRFNELYVEW